MPNRPSRTPWAGGASGGSVSEALSAPNDRLGRTGWWGISEQRAQYPERPSRTHGLVASGWSVNEELGAPTTVSDAQAGG